MLAQSCKTTIIAPAEETLRQLGKGDILAQKSHMALHHKAKTNRASGDLEVARGTRLQNLAVRSILVFNCTPCGENPTSTKKDGVLCHSFPSNILVKFCMLPLCRLQLLPRPYVFTAFDFNQVYVTLFCTQLMGLSYAGSCAGPL
eukprot:1158071-Pelagomonas_calceolata.AAC.11